MFQKQRHLSQSWKEKEKNRSAETVEEASHPWILLCSLASVYIQRSIHRDTNICVRLVLGAKPMCSGLSKDSYCLRTLQCVHSACL